MPKIQVVNYCILSSFWPEMGNEVRIKTGRSNEHSCAWTRLLRLERREWARDGSFHLWGGIKIVLEMLKVIQVTSEEWIGSRVVDWRWANQIRGFLLIQVKDDGRLGSNVWSGDRNTINEEPGTAWVQWSGKNDFLVSSLCKFSDGGVFEEKKNIVFYVNILKIYWETGIIWQEQSRSAKQYYFPGNFTPTNAS